MTIVPLRKINFKIGKKIKNLLDSLILPSIRLFVKFSLELKMKIKMAKFSKLRKISKEEEEDLLISFCKALTEIKTPEEGAHFLKDLLSRQEAAMLAKRIEIARLLIEGKTYSEIQGILKVSHGTVARVSYWLETSGEGYRMIAKRVKTEKSKRQQITDELEKTFSWKQMQRKYPSYFWPELLLGEIVKSARKSQKNRLKKILSKFEEKSDLFKQLDKILRNN